MKVLLLVLTVLILASLGAAPAQSTLFYVDKSLPIEFGTNYQTISGALRAAGAISGPHTIFITDIGGIGGNVYYESYSLNDDTMFAFSTDDLKITPKNPYDHIIIDAQGNGPCLVAMQCDNLTIENITFRNGEAALGGGDPFTGSTGGGLCIKQCTEVEILYCNFETNSAVNGGGLSCLSSTATLITNSIANNSATGNGGGIYAEASIIYGAGLTVGNNSAAIDGGGVWCGLDSYMRWINGSADTNSAGAHGGAVYIADSAGMEICGSISLAYPFNSAPAGNGELGYIETANGTALVGDPGWDYSPWWAGSPYTVQPAGNCPAKCATNGSGTQTVSIMNLPDRSGTGFCEAYGGNGVITVWGFPEGTPTDDIYLKFVGTPNIDFETADRKLHADYAVKYGRTEFRLSARGVGTTFPGVNPCYVYVDGYGALTDRDYPMDIYFNSPDITGDGVVCLADFALFLNDYTGATYNYRSDFDFSGGYFLNDINTFTSAYGLSWDSPVVSPACD